MKIVHVTFSSSGGAGKVANQLHASQCALGLESKLVSLTDADLRSVPFENFDLTVAAGLDEFVIKRKDAATQLSLSRAMIGKAISQVSQANPDIVHVHWAPGTVTKHQLLKLSQHTPIVATLHDYWIITGGCHFPGDCSNLESGCKDCPIVRGPFQSAVQANVTSDLLGEKLHLVAPSQFVRNKVEKLSRNFASFSEIPNPVFFGNLEADKFSSNLDGNIKFGLIATNLGDPRKGIRQLLARLNPKTNQNPDFSVHLVGGGSTSEAPFVKLRGPLESEELWNFIREIDVLVVPSKDETFGLVAAEAIGVGTQVWTVKDSAQAQLVRKFNGGAIFSDLEDMTDAIAFVNKRPPASKPNSQGLRNWVAPDKVATQYMELYNKILGAAKN